LNRSHLQSIRIIQELISQTRSGRLSKRWILGLVVLGAVYFLFQPVLQQKLGIDLPGLNDFRNVPIESTDDTGSDNSDKISPDDELDSFLQASQPGTYESPAGLRYTRGSQHGHRLKHLMAHAQDISDRPGQHGVFQSSDAVKIVALVDEAYLQALTGTNTSVERDGDRVIYTVILGRRIGYIGGESGNRRGKPSAQHLRMVLAGKNLITAFPYRP
jgi:hypothetical protein